MFDTIILILISSLVIMLFVLDWRVRKLRKLCDTEKDLLIQDLMAAIEFYKQLTHKVIEDNKEHYKESSCGVCEDGMISSGHGSYYFCSCKIGQKKKLMAVR